MKVTQIKTGQQGKEVFSQSYVMFLVDVLKLKAMMNLNVK